MRNFVDKDYKSIYWALLALMLRGSVTDLLKVFSLVAVEPFINIVAVLLFLGGLVVIFRKETLFLILSLLFFAMLWSLSAYLYPMNIEYMKESYIQFFIYTLPFMWMGYYLVRNGLFLDCFISISRYKLIIALFVQILIFIAPSRDIFEGDYQIAAYSLIAGLIGVYYSAVSTKNWRDIILSILGTSILLLAGSRSIFISVIYFWVLYYLTQSSFTKQLGVTIIVILLLFVTGPVLMTLLSSFAAQLGFSTHLVDALVSGSIFEDENRELLYLNFIDAILAQPEGYGIMGDRYVSYSTGFFFKPIYPHNIFLEVVVNFGLYIGIPISILFLYILIKSLFGKYDNQYKLAVLILSSTSFVKLLFAATYWADQMFFMLLGALCVFIFKKKRVII